MSEDSGPDHSVYVLTERYGEPVTYQVRKRDEWAAKAANSHFGALPGSAFLPGGGSGAHAHST